VSGQTATSLGTLWFYRPGAPHRWLRRFTQLLALAAILIAPLLGGWQRLDNAELAVWDDAGWNLSFELRDSLPAGRSAQRAYRLNRFIGGGIAGDYAGLPFVDPLAGALALLHSSSSPRGLVAIALPVLIALFAGRVFCGWFCAFGTLSRALDSLTVRIPFLPRPRLARKRPLRWLLLIAAVASSLLGVHVVLYLSLPYLLLQQSIYAAWLLGGGSVILAVLCGLLVAGVLIGPTVYCAALCPTGAGLSLLGRARVAHLEVVQDSSCGAHCQLCTAACWLQLDPSDGNAGPDCDLCGRCVAGCPKDNLGVTLHRPAPLRVTSGMGLLLVVGLGLAPGLAKASPPTKPVLVLEEEVHVGETALALSLVDMSGVELGLDWGVPLDGTELSVYVARGVLAAPAKDGQIAQRSSYAGPLEVTLRLSSNDEPVIVRFDAPNHPISTQRPTIYRSMIPTRFAPGDRLTVAPIAGFFEAPISFEVSAPGTREPLERRMMWLATAFLVYGAMLFLAVSVSPATSRAGNSSSE
jgi:ferredoxin-type protein NapH